MNNSTQSSGEPHSYKYWAFISYSHQDNLAARGDGNGDQIQWANWLHEQLETYRVPDGYRDRSAATAEPMPERFFPAFRDEAELPTSHDLGGQIRDALRRSRFLIVIASPRSAGSHYVNEEVRYFRQLGCGNRILTLIVDGEPNVRLRPKAGWTATDDCFCPALVHPLRPDGTVDETARLPEEPIAADVRVKDLEPPREMRASEHDQPDHRALLDFMKLKLIAGLMGVGLDELVQRDKRRADEKAARGSWMRALKGHNARLREDAARSLIRSGYAETVIESLSDKSRDVRTAAAQALCEFKVRPALPFLVSGLRNEGRHGRLEIVPGVEKSIASFGVEAIDVLVEEMRRGVPAEERDRFVMALIGCLDTPSLSNLLRNSAGLCDIALIEAALKSGLPLDKQDIEPFLAKLGRYGDSNEYFDDHFPAKASEWMRQSSIKTEPWAHSYVRSWLRLACVEGSFVQLVWTVDQMVLSRSALHLGAVNRDWLYRLALEVENMPKPGYQGSKEEAAASLRKIAEGGW